MEGKISFRKSREIEGRPSPSKSGDKKSQESSKYGDYSSSRLETKGTEGPPLRIQGGMDDSAVYWANPDNPTERVYLGERVPRGQTLLDKMHEVQQQERQSEVKERVLVSIGVKTLENLKATLIGYKGREKHKKYKSILENICISASTAESYVKNVRDRHEENWYVTKENAKEAMDNIIEKLTLLQNELDSKSVNTFLEEVNRLKQNDRGPSGS